MENNKIKSFNVIIFDFNSRKFISYDVMPYFIDCYEKIKNDKDCPKTIEEFKEFIIQKSMYMYWSRCQYEVILVDWPNQKTNRKIDVHYQIMNNIDIVTDILIKNVL